MSLVRRRGAVAAARTAGGPVTADIAASLPALTQAATGTALVAGAVSGDIGATLPGLTQAVAGSVEVRADIAATLPELTQAATGTAPFGPLTDITWAAVYSADEITGLSDTDPVGQWDDESGNANHLTSTLTERPLYVAASAKLNSKPAVSFDGTNDQLIRSGSPYVTQPWTWVIVGWIENVTADQKAMHSNQSGSTNTALTKRDSSDGTNPNTLRLFAGSGPVENTTEPVGNSPFIAIIVGNGSSSNVRVNGVDTTGNAGTRNMNSLTLASEVGVGFTEGEYAFVGVVDGELTTGQRDDLEQWAVDNLGVSLAP